MKKTKSPNLNFKQKNWSGFELNQEKKSSVVQQIIFPLNTMFDIKKKGKRGKVRAISYVGERPKAELQDRI